ncbi:MAG: 3-phosphoshikimate 1-carboxyvinyltransferase, partial [Candidatus Adiutrix sp.]|nr:3-phosphoshikimate 1-carboxyvinyltransferase [Candidatus Adiutrix sp.]
MEDARVIGRFPAGTATPPPSKSLSQRAIICGALAARRGAGGESLIRNLDFSEDVSASLAAVRALGARTERQGDVLRILPGRGPGAGLIDCGESGATLRFMLPIAALDDRETVFTGRGRLLERPLAAYAGVFAAAGARFSQEPHRVAAQGPLRGGDYALPGDVSSQFVSGLLLALPLAP